MSDLFNYRNANLIGSVIEGYEYNFSKGEVDVISSIFYIIDKTELLVKGNTIKTEVYVVVLIDPAYTTYTSIESSNLILTSITYVTTDSIIEIKEFPKTTPLVSMENGLIGANIKGYEYNPSKQESDVILATCKIVDKIKILISDVLTDVYVCVLYSGTTGSNKLYVPFTSVTEIVSFGIIDYGRPSVLRYTGMNFKQDATATTILFLDITTGNILREESINTIQASNTPPSSDIVIKRTGGEEVVIYGLELSVTQINGASAGATIGAAVIALNGLFTNTGTTTNAPTITNSASLSMNQGASLNFTPTTTDAVTISYDSLPTGIVRKDGHGSTIIGGSLLVAGSYNIELRVVNYYGAALMTIVLVISTPFVNTLSLSGTGNAYMRNVDGATYNTTAFYRVNNGSGITEAWSCSFWLKTNFTATNNQSYGLILYGTAGNAVKSVFTLLHDTANAGTDSNLYFKFGRGDCYTVGLTDIGIANNTWFHCLMTYNGGATVNTGAGFFNFYVNGVLKTTTWSFVGPGLYSSTLNMTINKNNGYDLVLLSGAKFYNYNRVYAPNTKIEEFATWKGVELGLSDALSLYNSGAPFDLNALFTPLPYTYFRCGDNGDVAAYPIMADNGTSGIDLTMYSGTVANYVSDVP